LSAIFVQRAGGLLLAGFPMSFQREQVFDFQHIYPAM
jgi:hypothetical protein